MKYRTKPVEVEAFQWDGTDGGCHEALATFDYPKCFIIESHITMGGPTPPLFRIHTLEGTMRVSPGDFVIRGLKGEFYTCKPEIFHMKYEAVQ